MGDILKEIEKKMEGAIAHLKEELQAVRSGRANPALLQNVTVDVYGSAMRLQDIASISVPEARMLVVSPFDRSNLHAILKGIEIANLNLQSYVDGQVVRVKVPEMDRSVREKMVTLTKKMGEEAKISIRNTRREGNDFIKKEKTTGKIPEDLMKSLEKKIQEKTDSSCKKIDEICQLKEKEILTV